MAEYRNNYRQRESKSVYGERNTYEKKKNYRNGNNRQQNLSQKMYYDKRQQGNSGRQMNDSKLRRKIMADDNVKFICSRNEDVIHDKSCILTRNIKDYDLKYLVNYPKWMKQCPKCAIEAYLRYGAEDYDKLAEYDALFRLMMMSVEMIRHMYIDCDMKTRINGDTLTIHHKEDTWKIVYLDSPGNVRLLHNNYHIVDEHREFEKGFHIQSEFTSNTKIKYAIENIETYSWSMHRVHEREAMLEQKKNETGKMGFWSRVARAFRYVFHKQEEDESKNQTDDNRKDDPIDFQLDFSDFNFVNKFGYPDNGTRCIYIWKTKNGIYQWQIGEYVSKKRQFVIKFSDQTFITDWRKVIAWKYVWKGDLNWSYGEKNETNPDRN